MSAPVLFSGRLDRLQSFLARKFTRLGQSVFEFRVFLPPVGERCNAKSVASLNFVGRPARAGTGSCPFSNSTMFE